jgi:hypothetical protein
MSCGRAQAASSAKFCSEKIPRFEAQQCPWIKARKNAGFVAQAPDYYFRFFITTLRGSVSSG